MRTKQELLSNKYVRLELKWLFRYAVAMLTVLIETRDHEDPLARTLASLVGGAVAGIVRDVIVRDLGSTDQTDQVADDAGCRWMTGTEIGYCIDQARADWLLLLEPGARLMEGWMEEVADHISQQSDPARFSPSGLNRKNLLLRLFDRASPLSAGLLITRRQALDRLKGAQGTADLAKGLATRRLHAGIIPAGFR